MLIDTAGRYTTQDSDAKADQKSWLAFLDLLKRNRPQQPINGVIVAISLEDLMTLPPERARTRMPTRSARACSSCTSSSRSISRSMRSSPRPTSSPASANIFGNFTEQRRRQVWGATFQTEDKTRNMIGEVPAEFDALIERLTEELPDRLQEEPTPNARVAIFGFPAQIAALKRPVFEFLNQIFEPTRYQANANLRGFYFTSGTQEGTPIDQVLGALARSPSAPKRSRASSYSGTRQELLPPRPHHQGRSSARPAGSRPTARAVRRARIIKAAAYARIVLAVGWPARARGG